MQPATVTQDVPGLGVQGIMRVRNGAAAGPFGGSVAFTQGAAARKRAIAYRLKKRMEIGGRN